MPLFLAGCFFAFIMVPKAVAVLLGFTPEGAYNLQDGSQYLNFVLKFIVAFGCAFLLPVFLVALNLVGVLPARAMLKGWRPAVMIIFVFAAIMTPDARRLHDALPRHARWSCSTSPRSGSPSCSTGARRSTKPDWLDVADDQASAL